MRRILPIVLLGLAIAACGKKDVPAPAAQQLFPHYKPSDAAKYFHYPNTTMLRTQGDETMTLTFSTNSSQRTDNSAPPEFHETAIDGNYSLSWRFVGMTVSGDEYHFTLQHHAPTGWEKPDEMDVTFQGSKLTIVDKPDIKLELFPEPPAKQ